MKLRDLLAHENDGAETPGLGRLPRGYVRAVELFDAGTRIAVRTAGGGREFSVEEDTILTIGPDGEVEQCRETEFEQKYRFYPDWPYRFDELPDLPVAEGFKDGTEETLPLLSAAHVCVPAERVPDGTPRPAVIFDLDGTLMDTLEDLKEAVNAALAFGGMPLCTLEQVREFVGNGIRKLMLRAVPDGDANPGFEEVFAFFREYYDRHCLDHSAPYENILSLLEELHAQGVPMAIVSNKVDSAVKELNRMFFADYISAALGDMEGVARKPAPDMVEKVLVSLGVGRNAIYIGDSDVDIQTAANAKLPCISVTWGFRGEVFLKEHGAQTLIQRPLELLYLI